MRILLFLALFLGTSAYAAAQDSERVTLYFGTHQQPAYLYRGPSGDTIMVQDSAAERAIVAGQYDILRSDRRTSRPGGIVGGAVAGLIGGFVWHLSDGGSLWDIVDFVDENDEKFGTCRDAEDFPWRIAAGTLAGALVGGLIGGLLPGNARVSVNRTGLVVRIGNGSEWVPPVVPAEEIGAEPVVPRE